MLLSRARLGCFVTALSFIALSACGPLAPIPGEPSLGSTDVRHLAVAECSWEARCDPAFFARTYADATDCARILTLIDGHRYVDDPHVDVRPSDINACVAALDRQTGASCTSDVPKECRTRPGKIPNNGPCLSGADCGEHAHCEFVPGADGTAAHCGSCKADPAPTCDACAEGEACIDGKCQSKLAEGGKCAADDHCASGLVCHDRVCAKPLAVGAACDPAKGCDGENVCGAISHTCRAPLYAEFGQPCGTIGDDWVGCKLSACQLTDGKTGTCVAFVANGATCTAGGPPCEADEACIDGRCKQPVCW